MAASKKKNTANTKKETEKAIGQELNQAPESVETQNENTVDAAPDVAPEETDAKAGSD